jgi:hypothetical protein
MVAHHLAHQVVQIIIHHSRLLEVIDHHNESPFGCDIHSMQD